jgi:hypothetical protein
VYDQQHIQTVSIDFWLRECKIAALHNKFMIFLLFLYDDTDEKDATEQRSKTTGFALMKYSMFLLPRNEIKSVSLFHETL